MSEQGIVDDYVDAAVRGHEAARLDALAGLRRASPARVAARLLGCLLDDEPLVQRAAAEAAAIIVREAPSRSLWAVDRELRGGSPWLLRGVAPERVAPLVAGSGGIGALALLSMQRNGYTRETAVTWLGSHDDPLALRLLLLRLNDPVPAVGRAALGSIAPWLDARRAEAIVAALPLLATMQHTVRAAHSGVGPRLEAVLGRPAGAIERALRQAAREAKDEDVRGAAILRLVQGTDAEAIEAVRLGLGDRSPRVRLATARWVGASGRARAVQRAVLPALAGNPSPSIRLLALRILRGDPSAEAGQGVLARCFDGNAVVRYHARCLLRERGDRADHRTLALARLRDDGDRNALVGALAVLSDLGRREDIDAVRALAEHPVGRVAAEARRTLAILEQG